MRQMELVCKTMGIDEENYLKIMKDLVEPDEIKSFNDMFEIENQIYEGNDMIPLVLGL